MKFECPKCKKKGIIDYAKVPESGIYATCPNCQERFLIQKPTEFKFEPNISQEQNYKSVSKGKVPYVPTPKKDDAINKSNQKKKGMQISAICIVLVALVGLGYFYFTDQNAVIPVKTINSTSNISANETSKETARENAEQEQARQAEIQKQQIEQARQTELQMKQMEQDELQRRASEDAKMIEKARIDELRRQDAENARRMEQYEREQAIKEKQAKVEERQQKYRDCLAEVTRVALSNNSDMAHVIVGGDMLRNSSRYCQQYK